MVGLEWQSALYKATKEGIKFIPIKIDDCYPPQILTNTLYLDMYFDGFDNTLRNMFDIINDNDMKKYNKKFNNLQCSIIKKSKQELEIKIEALKLIEPNASFLFVFSNDQDDVTLKIISDSISINSSGTFSGNKNGKLCRINRVLTPGFPYEVVLQSKTEFKENDLEIWHQVGKDNYVALTNIQEHNNCL